jgi:hypothetical protein
MRTLRIALVCSLALLPIGAAAQQVCPCVPISHQWIVEACDSWNCAAAATILANGDPYVLTLPTGDDEHKWVVVRRIVAGSATVSPDAPFSIETFDDGTAAMVRFNGIDHALHPMVVTGRDGKFLVIARSAQSVRPRPAGR